MEKKLAFKNEKCLGGKRAYNSYILSVILSFYTRVALKVLNALCLNSLGQLNLICNFNTQNCNFFLAWSETESLIIVCNKKLPLHLKASNLTMITRKISFPFRNIPFLLYCGKNCTNQLCKRTYKDCELKRPFRLESSTHVAFCRL